MAESATSKSEIHSDFDLKLNSPDEYGTVPLHKAVTPDDVHLLEHLLKQSHLDVNDRNYDGETPSISSLRMRRTNSFIAKLRKAGFDINATNKFGNTCLHVAVLWSSIDVLHTLIEGGAKVNVQDYEQETPLHYAVRHNNLEAVCMLLYYGIDVSVLSKNQMSAFTLAVYWRRFNIAQVLFPYYDEFPYVDLDGYNVLHLTAWDKSELAFDLVNAGIDVNSLTFDGGSVIEASLHYKNADLFKLIWSKLNHKTLIYHKEPFLLTFIKILPFNSQERVECMYLILESPLAFELMDHCRNDYRYEGLECELFSKLLEAFCQFAVGANDRVTIIYICLSLGCTVTISDINCASTLYGFNEELEIFLYFGDFNLRPIDLDNYFNLLPQLAFIFSLNDPNPNLVVDLLKKWIQILMYLDKMELQNNIVNALSFFSIPFNGKQKILSFCHYYMQEYDMIAIKLKNLPEIPSLLELSRNQARRYLQSSYSLKKPYQFCDLVKKLKLPTILQDVVNFKKPLYL